MLGTGNTEHSSISTPLLSSSSEDERLSISSLTSSPPLSSRSMSSSFTSLEPRLSISMSSLEPRLSTSSSSSFAAGSSGLTGLHMGAQGLWRVGGPSKDGETATTAMAPFPSSLTSDFAAFAASSFASNFASSLALALSSAFTCADSRLPASEASSSRWPSSRPRTSFSCVMVEDSTKGSSVKQRQAHSVAICQHLPSSWRLSSCSNHDL
mmetsp:Transcript_4270/g.9745  ORF Transcript_4270/g.9745 Transcript_4270/m.9745 type:complete len:210 (+) Transcript_4270:372-1001(+)